MPSTILNYNPMHTELPLAIFVGDHDPAHAQGIVFQVALDLPGGSVLVLISRASCVVAIAISGAMKVMQAIVGFLLSENLTH